MNRGVRQKEILNDTNIKARMKSLYENNKNRKAEKKKIREENGKPNLSEINIKKQVLGPEGGEKGNRDEERHRHDRHTISDALQQQDGPQETRLQGEPITQIRKSNQDREYREEEPVKQASGGEPIALGVRLSHYRHQGRQEALINQRSQENNERYKRCSTS